jgi:hypothetical protein
VSLLLAVGVIIKSSQLYRPVTKLTVSLGDRHGILVIVIYTPEAIQLLVRHILALPFLYMVSDTKFSTWSFHCLRPTAQCRLSPRPAPTSMLTAMPRLLLLRWDLCFTSTSGSTSGHSAVFLGQSSFTTWSTFFVFFSCSPTSLTMEARLHQRRQVDPNRRLHHLLVLHHGLCLGSGPC